MNIECLGSLTSQKRLYRYANILIAIYIIYYIILTGRQKCINLRETECLTPFNRETNSNVQNYSWDSEFVETHTPQHTEVQYAV